MTEDKMIRLSQAARELNVGISTITEILAEKGFEVENKANSKITMMQFEAIASDLGLSGSALEQKLNSLSMKKNMSETVTDVEVLVSEKEEAPELKETVFEKIKTTNEANEAEKNLDTPINKNADDIPIEVEKVSGLKKLGGLKVVDIIDLNPKKEVKKISKNKEKTEPAENNKEKEGKNKQKEKSITTPENKSEKDIQEIVNQKENNKSEEKIPVEKLEKDEPIEIAKIEEEDEIKAIEPVFDKKIVEPEKEIEQNTEEIKEFVEEKIQNVKDKDPNLIEAKGKTLQGLKIVGKIELPVDKSKNKPVASSDDRDKRKRKRKKKRIRRTDQQQPVVNTANQSGNKSNNLGDNANKKPVNQNQNNISKQQNSTNNSTNTNTNTNSNTNTNTNANKRNRPQRNQVKKPVEISDSEIQRQIKDTLAQLSGKSKQSRLRKKFRHRDKEAENAELLAEGKLLKVTEFISANDLANLMGVTVTEVISACMSMGMFISINQRLDAEAITVIADEFGYDVEFISTVEDDKIVEEEEKDAEEDLLERAPIVTIMGHVDHGKTSLLDYIRHTNVTASESGGITQHIGAYDVITEGGKRIAFLDTPGHEAFTAMRARGAKVTDIVILVVAADDSVMPQTKEAINHAKVAGVRIVIAINKIDKPTANPAKIREELSQEDILVESWGGKFQEQEISAKTGIGIAELLEKVLLEAELLELKANPNKKAKGTVIEASLDKGKGYVATVLVQTGTMKVGDVILAGSHFGRIKAMNDHRGNRLLEAGPSTPVQVLGLDGAPQAGDILRVMGNEREAREIALKREQILREQNIRATKGLTLEEIGRRRALGNFKELRIIIKGDFDGSVEALSDSLLKLSTEEIEIKIIHKAVGQISEADILLASASEAIIIGFQVRPSLNAKKAAEQEKVQIKLYSIIYNAIEEIKDAMEGMLAPKVEEIIVGNVEIRQIFKISKIGTVAGCYVTDGYIKKANKVRLIRDGIVTYEGEIGALKRFKEDVTEVKSGYECGLSIRSFNDLKVGDVLESFEQKETKRTL